VWLTSVALDQLLRRLILVTYASSQWHGKQFLTEHVVNVKTLNGSEHDGRSFKISRIWRNQFLTTVCSTFNPTCDAQMRTSIHLLNVVWIKYDHFFYCKTDHFRCVLELDIICFYRPTVHMHWRSQNGD
jgi:hypothetical protein